MEKLLKEEVIIRLARPEDKNIIVNIQFNALKVLAAKDYNRQQLRALLKSKSTPRKSLETIFIAEVNHQVVGFASLLYPFNTIGAVFVAPEFARRSIGTQLLHKIEWEATRREVPILWVYSSLTGYNFYRANGYDEIRTTALPLYSTYIPCVYMKKRLLPVTVREVMKEISQLLAVLVIAIVLISFLLAIG